MRPFPIPRRPLWTLAVLAAGAACPLLPNGAPWRDRLWLTGLVILGAPLAWQTIRGMLRGQFASDVVAMLAIVGAVGLQEPLAGLVVVLMQTGGEALETYAVARASSAVATLEADAPRRAHRVQDGVVTDIDAVAIVPNDMLLVRPGEMVPCDATVTDGVSHVDTSRLTGEPIPVKAMAGTPLLSGSVNQEGVLTLRALRASRDSQYARIVDLVRTAQASKSPLQRTADRFAVWFTPLTLVVCAAAWWMSHDVSRILAVLVIATPCPLILAAPVAIIGGINRAARRGIIVRNGSALEGLAHITAAVFDKTGTLTVGRPRIHRIVTDGDGSADQLLALAASLEHGSGHLLARVVVAEAEARGLVTTIASATVETPGRGVHGEVGGRTVAVGAPDLVAAQLPALAARIEAMAVGADGLHAYVGSSDGLVGRIEFADALRSDLDTFLQDLSALGVREVSLLSGDRPANVAQIAAQVGITTFAGGLSPEDKAVRVHALQQQGYRVLMVGDGTNDAPALTAASVGVALAGHGGGVVTEAADVVLLVDEPARVTAAIRIGRRSMRIAQQSIGVGLGLSLLGMVAAAFGQITPIAGALTQEAIDVAVILNALRASFDER
ncbi:MAG: heavy metal translocating P-type ATPase [Gemmatimonadaceae bacterium]